MASTLNSSSLSDIEKANDNLAGILNENSRKKRSFFSLSAGNCKVDPAKDPERFHGLGIDFKGKFIGEREVKECRGMDVFKEAMHAAKAAVKASGCHKPRIMLNVSLDGLKVKDERSLAILYKFPVEKISFLARDPSDYRALGFIFRDADDKFKFFGIKTALSSEVAYNAISDLFIHVAELRKKCDVSVKEDDTSDDCESKENSVASSAIVVDLLDLDASGENMAPNTTIPEDPLSSILHVGSTPVKSDPFDLVCDAVLEVSPPNLKKRPAPLPPSSDGLTIRPSNSAINDPHAVAKYIYVDKETNETFCEPDDILLLKKKLDEHWTFVCNVRTGISAPMPVAFLDVKVPLLSDFSPTDGFRSTARHLARAIHDYNTGVEGDLTFQTGDWINVIERVNQLWLRGEVFGQRGIFPLSFVQIEDLQAIPYERPKSASLQSPSNFDYPKVTVTAMYDYSSDLADDLSFHAGDVIEIVKYVDDEWIMGRLGDKMGLLPLNFVKHNS